MCVHSGNCSGGVPLFWAHARTRVLRPRVAEFTQQYAPYWPVFGIGIIWAGATGTAEPDDGSRVAEWPVVKGRGATSLWQTLCGEMPPPPLSSVGDRLPAVYVQRPLLCILATAANMETILWATKRTVPKPTLDYTMALPWNTTREQLHVF